MYDYKGGGNPDVYAQRILTVQDQVSQPPEASEQPLILVLPQGGGDIAKLLLSPLGLGIVGGIAAYSIIATVLLAKRVKKNNEQIIVINKKIGSKSTSKDLSKISKNKEN